MVIWPLEEKKSFVGSPTRRTTNFLLLSLLEGKRVSKFRPRGPDSINGFLLDGQSTDQSGLLIKQYLSPLF